MNEWAVLFCYSVHIFTAKPGYFFCLSYSAKEIAVKKLEELEKTKAEAVTEATGAKLACSELEAALERSLSRLEEVLNREAEAREKVDEALQIVETALIERDAALKQASQASGNRENQFFFCFFLLIHYIF